MAPEGGYFLWVELPEEVDTEQLLAAASERGVVFVKGPDFMLEGGRNALRLAYSGVTPEQIDEGVRRLGEALAAHQGARAAALAAAASAAVRSLPEHQLLGKRGARRR